jgi:hypothetical protein
MGATPPTLDRPSMVVSRALLPASCHSGKSPILAINRPMSFHFVPPLSRPVDRHQHQIFITSTTLVEISFFGSLDAISLIHKEPALW